MCCIDPGPAVVGCSKPAAITMILFAYVLERTCLLERDFQYSPIIVSRYREIVDARVFFSFFFFFPFLSFPKYLRNPYM